MPRPRKGQCPDAIAPYRWKKGQSGNPAGPKPRKSFETLVSEILDEQVPGTELTRREALARMFVKSLLDQSPRMVTEFLAREWPVVQRHEVGLSAVEPSALEAAFDRLFAQDEKCVPAKPNGNGAA